jgi:hypothetical protein
MSVSMDDFEEKIEEDEIDALDEHDALLKLNDEDDDPHEEKDEDEDELLGKFGLTIDDEDEHPEL